MRHKERRNIVTTYFNKGIESLKNDGFIILLRKIKFFVLNRLRRKDNFHFVKEYETYVKNLIKAYPIDEAMSIAVGGDYEKMGHVEKEILMNYGLKPNMSLIDYGCGSGRLAQALPAEYNINYLGVDIVEQLLQYAKIKSKPNYRFIRHRKLSVPAESESADMICAFSLFTHLLHEETYIYMEDMKRVLKKGGKLVFSFLELGNSGHWPVFMDATEGRRKNTASVFTAFIERSVIEMWAKKLGWKIVEIKSGGTGQSLAVIEKE